MLEAAFVRSPVAHGVIRSIATQRARKLTGVHAVYTLADLRSVMTGDRLPLQFPSSVLPQDIGPFILAGDEVCFVGEAIAMVVADNRYVAEDAAEQRRGNWSEEPDVAAAPVHRMVGVSEAPDVAVAPRAPERRTPVAPRARR